MSGDTNIPAGENPMFGKKAPEAREIRDSSGQEMRCVKCRHHQFSTDEFRATGGNFAKFFDVQNKKFTTVSCGQCGYTELYRGDTNTVGNVLDFFTGG